MGRWWRAWGRRWWATTRAGEYVCVCVKLGGSWEKLIGSRLAAMLTSTAPHPSPPTPSTWRDVSSPTPSAVYPPSPPLLDPHPLTPALRPAPVPPAAPCRSPPPWTPPRPPPCCRCRARGWPCAPPRPHPARHPLSLHAGGWGCVCDAVMPLDWGDGIVGTWGWVVVGRRVRSVEGGCGWAGMHQI